MVLGKTHHWMTLFPLHKTALNTSEIPDLLRSPDTELSPAALLLWNSSPFGALICQVLLTAPSEAFCEELYYVSRTGHSARSLLFYLGRADIVWCALFTPAPWDPSLPHVDNLLHLSVHTYTQTHYTHTHRSTCNANVRLIQISVDLSCQLWWRMIVRLLLLSLWHFDQI